MDVSKLSISTRMGIDNNFGFPKGQNETIGAMVKVSKNIDKELKDLGASIQGLMQGRTTGEIFTIRFPINSLDKISEIDGLVYLDIGENMSSEPNINSFALVDSAQTNMTIEDKFYEKLGIKYSNSGWGIKSRPMGRLLVLGALVIGYFAYKKFNK